MLAEGRVPRWASAVGPRDLLLSGPGGKPSFWLASPARPPVLSVMWQALLEESRHNVRRQVLGEVHLTRARGILSTARAAVELVRHFQHHSMASLARTTGGSRGGCVAGPLVMHQHVYIYLINHNTHAYTAQQGTRHPTSFPPDAKLHARYMLSRLRKSSRKGHRPIPGLLLLLVSTVLMVMGRLPGAAGFLLASCSSSRASLLLGAHRASLGSAVTTIVSWYVPRYVQTYTKRVVKDGPRRAKDVSAWGKQQNGLAGTDARNLFPSTLEIDNMFINMYIQVFIHPYLFPTAQEAEA